MSLGPRSLSDLHQIKNAVRTLQRNAKEQLALEQETQQTFDHLHQQISSLKSAFSVLSDVVMDEVDAVRSESEQRLKNLERRMEQYERYAKQNKAEYDLIRQGNELWMTKEREWAKDNEILKTSQAKVGSWIQQIQKDMMETREMVSVLRQEHSTRALQVSEEANALRAGWKSNMETMQQRLSDYDETIERTQNELNDLTQQRICDLELMERAMNTIRQQQIRMKSAVDESIANFISDMQHVNGRADQMEVTVKRTRIDTNDLKRELEQQQQTIKMRLMVIEKLLNKDGEISA